MTEDHTNEAAASLLADIDTWRRWNLGSVLEDDYPTSAEASAALQRVLDAVPSLVAGAAAARTERDQWRDSCEDEAAWRKHYQRERDALAAKIGELAAIVIAQQGAPALAEGLERVRRRLCAYGPDAETCDCKYGASGKGEQTGCPELRQAIRALSGVGGNRPRRATPKPSPDHCYDDEEPLIFVEDEPGVGGNPTRPALDDENLDEHTRLIQERGPVGGNPTPATGPKLNPLAVAQRKAATAAFDHCEYCHRPLPHNDAEARACPALGVSGSQEEGALS